MRFLLPVGSFLLTLGVPKPDCLQALCRALFGLLFLLAFLRSFTYLHLHSLHSFEPFCIRQSSERPWLAAAYHSLASLLTIVFGRFWLAIEVFLLTSTKSAMQRGVFEIHKNAPRICERFSAASPSQCWMFWVFLFLHWPCWIFHQ